MNGERTGVRYIAGRAYLTLDGFNRLRALVGLDPIKIRPGEDLRDFFRRQRQARRDFYVAHPEACVGIMDGNGGAAE